jgi:CyaY protein
MDEATFDTIARKELAYIEEALMDVDPDDVEVSSSDGILRLELSDGVRVVINSHRAAGQIWMAAVASAWRFNPEPSDGRWRTAAGEELRATIASLLKERIGIDVTL